MGKVIYQSGPDHSGDNPACWYEKGDLPQCVDTFRLGDFTCRCGKHRVQACVIPDPLDSQDRTSRTVILI